MLKIYGSMLCPDCVACRKDLDDHSVSYEYYDFSDSLLYLKEFLALRDTMDIFYEARQEGRIGIPCLVEDNGTVSLDWEKYVSQDKA